MKKKFRRANTPEKADMPAVGMKQQFMRFDASLQAEIAKAQDNLSERRNWLGFVPNDKELLRLLQIAQGRKAEVADLLGVTLTCVNARINRSPLVKEGYETIREKLLDRSESVLMKAAHVKEDMGAVYFHLSRKGRHRGYGDKVDMQVTREFKVTVDDRRKIDSLRTLSKDDLLRLEEMNKKIVEAKGRVIG